MGRRMRWWWLLGVFELGSEAGFIRIRSNGVFHAGPTAFHTLLPILGLLSPSNYGCVDHRIAVVRPE